MDLELLRTFLELHRLRHFGRAALALNVTQAAVSSRLKSLETQLGVQLFQRDRRGMRITPEGSRLVRHAERLIAGWRAARQDVALAASGGQLVVGGSLRLADVLLQPWLRKLRHTNPDLAIIGEAQSPPYLIQRLVEGYMDVALMFEPAQLEVLQIRAVSEVQLMLVSTRPEAVVEQALASGFVYVDWGLSHGLEFRREFPDAPEARTRVSDGAMALDLLTRFGGSAYLPERSARDRLRSGMLFEVAGAPRFTRIAYATWPVRSARVELIEQCLALIED